MPFIEKFKRRAHRLKDSLQISPRQPTPPTSVNDPKPNLPHHATIESSTLSSDAMDHVNPRSSSTRAAVSHTLLPTVIPLGAADTEKYPSAKELSDEHILLVALGTVPGPSVPPSAGQNVKKAVWTGLKAFLGLLNKSADAFGPLKSAVDGLSRCIEIYERVAQGHKDLIELGKELDLLFSDLSKFFSASIPPAMTPTIINLAQGIEKETKFLTQMEQRNSIERVAELLDDKDEILECYRRIQRLLQRVALNVDFETWKIVDKMATDNRLKDLSPSRAAWYSSAESTNLRREGCTPNTRIEVMKTLRGWAVDEKSEKIYWLNGMAGTGKTTIAYTLCDYLETTNKLAASFFCSRQLPQCRDTNLILPTISYQLGIFSYPFKCALSQALERNPDAHTRKLSEQFKKLIVEPLREVAHTMPSDLVVVIDALDECDSSEGLGQMLNVLLSYAPDLPLRFFTTSRPEPRIRDRMMGPKGEHTRRKLHLHELERSVVKEDIRTFLLSKLQPISISPGDLDRLVERSGVLFIYAATAVRYISDDEFSRSGKRLQLVLDASYSSPNNNDKEVDALYTAILHAAFDDVTLEQHEKEEMYQVLHTILCAQEPLTVHVLSGLLGLDSDEAARPALRPLLSVLNVSETTGLVTTLHESFSDYIFNQSRSGTFYCDKKRHHARLAQSCFDLIGQTKPIFNICGLESSYVFDEEIADLDQRIEKAISKELFYACRYWGNHIKPVDMTQSLFDALHRFLSVHLLLWMEILSLKKCLPDGAGLLAEMQTWSQNIECPDNIKILVEDAWKFTIGVASGPISRSTPHIYVSALTFWPKQRPISKYYSYESEDFMETYGAAMRGRDSATIAAFTAGSEMTWATYSPDGSRILSSSEDNSIRIWDAHTGQMMGEPLMGHTGSVQSVAYSPDGTRIVSGSEDKTIRIWNAQSGQMIGKPLEGHTDEVYSVVYSPDGTRIASGSKDNTILIWNASTGQTVGDSLKGHTNEVWSVAYSPDGERIVSGSWDHTIRIWNAHNGQKIGEALEGHTDRVWSVVYSPDGTRIASGSDDYTVRIWDAHNGEMIGEPLESHTGEVYSVAYSPDGTRIASGSEDNTVRIWDASTGQMIGAPLEGHIEVVVSVAYSSDGTRIVSGSQDNTVRIWDACNNQMEYDLVEGHSDIVHSVAYSPDGTRIVSGSEDCTIRIWDAYTGQTIIGPLEEHDGAVYSVAYSPDATRIISGSSDTYIRIWDANTGAIIGEPLEGHTGEVYSVVYSPDGTRIVSGSEDNTIRIWDAHTGKTIGKPLEGHGNEVCLVVYSPDGKRIASASNDHTLRIWDIDTGHMIGEPLEGHTGDIQALAYSPNGTRIVSGSEDCTIRIWDACTGHLIGKPLEYHASDVYFVAYSPDGTRIASCSEDNTIQVWDANTGQIIGAPLEGHIKAVTSVVYSSDGTHLVSSSHDQVIRIWNADISHITYKLFEGHTNSANSVAYSPDGTRIISGAIDFTIRIWDAHTSQLIGEPLEGHTGKLYSVAYSFDGTRIVSGSEDKSIRIWDASTGLAVGKPFEGHTGEVYSVVYSPDGTRIASGSEDKTVRIWDAHTGQMIGQPLEGHTGQIYMVDYSSDGKRIVSGSEDCSIRIWDAHTGQIIGDPLNGHTAEVYSVAFSPDSTRIVSGSGDNTIRIWDTRDGHMIGKPLKGHTGTVNCVVYSPDGVRIASGSYDDTVRIWDSSTGLTIGRPFEGHPDTIWSIAYSPDGAYITSACEDSIVRTWNARFGEMDDPKLGDPVNSSSDSGSVPRHRLDTHFLNEDGWVTNDEQDLLVWVPPDVRGVTWHPQNTAVISARGSLKFDFSKSKLGRTWGDYYRA